jgi:hypothetical protein
MRAAPISNARGQSHFARLSTMKSETHTTTVMLMMIG